MLRSLQVTLTNANQTYSLVTLAQAISADFPTSCGELEIQFEPASPGGGKVFVGDSAMSATRRGGTMLPGDSFTYRDGANGVPVLEFFLRTDTAGALVNVQAMRR